MQIILPQINGPVPKLNWKECFQKLFLSTLIAIAGLFVPVGALAQTYNYNKQGGTSPITSGIFLNSSSAKKIQLIYLPGDFSISPINGNITRIYFRSSTANQTGTYTNFKVKIGQTTNTAFNPTTTFFTGLTDVVTSPSKVLTGSSTINDWFGIDLDIPFLYDNSQTLIVEVEYSAYTGGITTLGSTSSPNKKLYSSSTTATTGTSHASYWQDFGMDITPAVTCSGAPTSGTAATNVSSICAGGSITLSLTGTTVAAGIGVQWQSSLDGINFTDIPGATTFTYATTQTATTYYQAVVTCNGSNPATSNIVTVTTPVSVSGTFTINSAMATGGTNFQSFTDAVNYISCGIGGPVVFNVVPGSGPYNEQVIIPAISGTSATNTITFNGNGNTLAFASTNTNERAVIKFTGADYVTIDNLVIEATAGTYGFGIQLMNGSDNNTITNSTINSSLTSTSSNFAGIVASGSNTSATTDGVNANNTTITNNTIDGGYYGIIMSGNGTTGLATGNVISGNTVKNSHFYSVYLDDQDGALVSANDIHRLDRTALTTFYGIYISGASRNLIIEKNRIHDPFTQNTTSTSAAYGVYFTAVDAPSGSENIVKNNLIYNIYNNGTINAFYNSNSDGVYYYHNTINLDNPAHTAIARGFYQTTAASNIQFINNIVSITTGGAATNQQAIYLNTATTVLTSDFNNLYVPTGNIGYHNATQYLTLTDWQTANGAIYDQNSVSTDPLFRNVGTGNFTPTSSFFDNLGTPQAAVTDDIVGAPRDPASPDMGAYEFTPPSVDAGIALISPISPATAGPNTVTVEITNNQATPVSSIDLSYSDGTTTITENFSGLNIAQGATLSLNFAVQYNLTDAITLTVTILKVNGGTDPIAGNNTDSKFVCPTLAGGTYTINSAAVTGGTNFQSFTDAVNRLTCSGISGPVVFNVVAASGPYTEQIEIPEILGASATNTITFNGNGNTLQANPITSNRAVVKLNGADYVTIDNLTIATTGTTTSDFGWGIHFINGADNNTISNNTINIGSLSTTESNSVGIVFVNSTTSVTTTTGNNGNNNVIFSNTIIGAYKGIHLNNAVANPGNNQISNNTIRDFYTEGIEVNGANATLIEGNDISRNRTTVTTFYGIYLAGTAQNTVVSKNRIHNTHDGASSLTGTAYGIYSTANDAPTGSENIVKNNLIYNFNGTGTVYAIYNSSSNGIYYYNNTINLDNSASTGIARGFYQTTLASNIEFINNNVTITTGATAVNNLQAIYLATSTTSIISNHNNLYVPSGNIGYHNAIQYPTLTDWQTANSGAYDQNSVSADPMYAAPASGNLQPTNGAINNIGTPLAAVTDDITGALRDATSPDPGAYEFTPPPLDLGAIALASPTAEGCYGATETVMITIQNFGNDPVDFSIDPVTVNVSVTGAVTQNLTATVNTGTMAANTTLDVNVGTLNMSTLGTYTFNATTVVTGDGNATNDAMLATDRLNTTISAFPHLEDFESFTVGTNATGFMNDWTVTPAATTSAFRWNVDEGPTPSASSNTGPAVDHTTGTATGKYVFTESSSGATGAVAELISPCIDLSSLANPAMEFWYHMYGATMGTLNVDVYNGTTWVLGSFTITGQQQTATTDPWLKANIDLSTYSGSIIKVRFRAERGSSYTGDIAIDDIRLYELPALDLGAVALATPVGCYSNAEPVIITVKNFGTGMIDFTATPATVTVNVTSTVTQTLSVTLTSGTLAAGTSQDVTVGTLNMTTAGTYTFNSFVTITGDGDATNDAMIADTRTVTTWATLPQNVDFTGFNGSNLPTLFQGWTEASGAVNPIGTTSGWANDDFANVSGGVNGISAKINLWNTGDDVWIIGPKINPTATTELRFDLALTLWNNTNAATLGSDDAFKVMISTDCGSTYTAIKTYDASTPISNTGQKEAINLSAYAGQDIIIAFFATEGSTGGTSGGPNDVDLFLDNIFIGECTPGLWNGQVSTDWNTPGNWSCSAVPAANANVTIPARAKNYPQIPNGTAMANDLIIESGASVTINGGTLQLAGNLNNSGTFSNTSGTLELTGLNGQLLSGVSTLTNLTVSGSGTKSISTNLTISGILTMTAGLLNTESSKITLAGTATMSETNTSYVIGQMETARDLNTAIVANFGGIGLEITPAAGSTMPGSTTVRRVTGTQMNAGGPGYSIPRYFDIQSAVNANLDVTMVFHYLDHEVAAYNEASLVFYRSTNQGGSWKADSASVADPNNNQVTLAGISAFSFWTLGDLNSPLPVDLVVFEAAKKGNDAILNWETVSEQNSLGFEIEVSTNSHDFRKIGFAESRNGNTLQRYSFTDTEKGKNGTRYYRLKQIDFDGGVSYSPIRAVNFGELTFQARVYPNPFSSGFKVAIESTVAAEVPLILTDLAGKTVWNKAVKVEKGANQLNLEPAANLPAGVYLLHLQIGNERFTTRLIKQ